MTQAIPNLANLDIEFLLDRSGSMLTKDCAGGKKTRWEYGRETMTALAGQVQTHDPDGITVCVFARLVRTYDNVTTGARIDTIYKEVQPAGGTDTAKVVGQRLDAYFERKKAGKAKPLCLFVLTDGVPDDEAELKKVIIQASNRIEKDEEIAICFVQVGKDEDATKFLKELDDGLTKQGAKFDIVDTLPIDEIENLTVEELLVKAFTD
ncbi:MAG: VWA domain-containing protein [Candidatus Obscuribacterales bacterium]|nr:VWA domain-containing protein [Candidatus Obscuribacterales bacterium]